MLFELLLSQGVIEGLTCATAIVVLCFVTSYSHVRLCRCSFCSDEDSLTSTCCMLKYSINDRAVRPVFL